MKRIYNIEIDEELNLSGSGENIWTQSDYNTHFLHISLPETIDLTKTTTKINFIKPNNEIVFHIIEPSQYIYVLTEASDGTEENVSGDKIISVLVPTNAIDQSGEVSIEISFLDNDSNRLITCSAHEKLMVKTTVNGIKQELIPSDNYNGNLWIADKLRNEIEFKITGVLEGSVTTDFSGNVEIELFGTGENSFTVSGGYEGTTNDLDLFSKSNYFSSIERTLNSTTGDEEFSFKNKDGKILGSIPTIAGEKGDKGDRGEKGDTGENGIQGQKGDAFTYSDFTQQQLEALIGPKGEDGEQGEQGIQGPKGEDGQKGEDGVQGPKGENGENGVGISSIEQTFVSGKEKTYTITLTNNASYDFIVTDGADGKNGVDGVNGADGIDGKSFSISKIYSSVQLMNADFSNPETKINDFVLISNNEGNIENGFLYVKGDTQFNFVVDMSTNTIIDLNNYYTKTESDERYARLSELHTVATSGSYNDLKDKPTIPTTDNLLEKGEGLPIGTTAKTIYDIASSDLNAKYTKIGERITLFSTEKGYLKLNTGIPFGYGMGDLILNYELKIENFIDQDTGVLGNETINITLQAEVGNSNRISSISCSDRLFAEAVLIVGSTGNYEVHFNYIDLGITSYRYYATITPKLTAYLGYAEQVVANDLTMSIEFVEGTLTKNNVPAIIPFKDKKTEALLGKPISGWVSGEDEKTKDGIYLSISGTPYQYLGGWTPTEEEPFLTELIEEYWEEFSLNTMNKVIPMTAEFDDGTSKTWEVRVK